MVQHVVSSPTPPLSAMEGAAQLHQIPIWRDNFAWILVCTATREAAVIDGPEAAPVLEYAARHGMNLRTIINTHTHRDHIGINRELAAAGELAQMRVIGNATLSETIPGLSEPVGDGARIHVGRLEGRAILTEGHIDGHLSYLFGDLLFCGDTLFAGGCGYLFDGPPSKMFASLRALSALPTATKVVCAHEYTADNLRFAWSVEPDNSALADRLRWVWAKRAEGRATVPSTIADELATNPFLRWGSQTLRANVAEALPDFSLTTDAEVFAATRALKDRKLYKKLMDSDLPVPRPTL